MYGINSYEELYNALFEWGSDAIIIEDEDTAKACFKVFSDATIKDEHLGNEISKEMKQALDLTEENNVKRIITFVNGSAGSLCLAQDLSVYTSTAI